MRKGVYSTDAEEGGNRTLGAFPTRCGLRLSDLHVCTAVFVSTPISMFQAENETTAAFIFAHIKSTEQKSRKANESFYCDRYPLSLSLQYHRHPIQGQIQPQNTSLEKPQESAVPLKFQYNTQHLRHRLSQEFHKFLIRYIPQPRLGLFGTLLLLLPRLLPHLPSRHRRVLNRVVQTIKPIAQCYPDGVANFPRNPLRQKRRQRSSGGT